MKSHQYSVDVCSCLTEFSVDAGVEMSDFDAVMQRDEIFCPCQVGVVCLGG
jgi:hypothetical protein